MSKKKRKNEDEEILEIILSDKGIRKDVVQKSFEHFFPIYFHRYMVFETPDFHKEMFRILEDESVRFAVICAFRGSAKSTIITTAYVLWSILGVQQRKFVVIEGLTEQKARLYLTEIKNELLHNELLQKDLGPFTEERDSIGNATAIIIKKLNVKIMIGSVGQSIRGMRHNEHRPDLIIVDDIEDTDSVKTKESRDKTFNWLASEVIPAGSKKTRFIVVGNLLHEDSVLMRLRKKIENGEMRLSNAIYREYPIIDENGVPLWPGRYPTPEAIEAEREITMDDIVWSREYLLKIISTTERVVHPEWIQFYNKTPYDGLRSIAIGIDLAVSQKESADCTAMVVGHIYGHGNKMEIYIQPNPINERVVFPVQMEYVKSLVAVQKQKHNRVKIYIENNGYQEALVQLCESQKYDVEGVPTGKSDKMARLRLTTSFIKEGRVLFPETGCEELIEQLIGFGKEKHDDLADAFALLILKAIQNNPKQGSAGLFGKHRFDAI
ncbi:phage terminase large subunit [Candidatus Parcubacteria bacterium]|nr:phage terminase large subunit [Candidatus Parcubacteria bacterium]